jgi:hypothetical protein
MLTHRLPVSSRERKLLGHLKLSRADSTGRDVLCQESLLLQALYNVKEGLIYSGPWIFVGCAMRTINQRVAIACRDVGKGREQERKLCRLVRMAHPTIILQQVI